MSKYGMKKYATFKYGRYVAVNAAVKDSVKYRVKAYGGESIVIQHITIYGDMRKIRVRSNSSEFVTMQSITIDGMHTKVRIRSNDSEWVVLTKVLLEGGG